jgi:hypothetical protein
MVNSFYKSIQTIGYFLAPEISPKQDQDSYVPGRRILLTKGVMGYAKSAVWILLSVVLAVALGQLN